MSLTSTGPTGFHIKPIVSVLAVVVFVAGVYAISQQILTDDQQSTPAAAEAVAETAEPFVGSTPAPETVVIEGQGSLYDALAAGKFDAGLVPEPSQTFASSQPAPEIVVIEGQGSNYDALIQGKYDGDFPSGAPGVQYFLGSGAQAGASSQLVEGLGDKTFAERPAAVSTAGNTPTVSGGHQE